MKINEWQRLTSMQTNRSSQHQSDKPSSSVSPKSSVKDEIQLSAQAREMLQVQRKTEESRSDAIEALRIAVENGTYEVDPKQLAEKLMPHLQNPPEMR
jgi:negative regulator of flagellin synthesis FlgM